MSDPPRAPFTALYLAAGLSSRFGFRVKCLQEVGRSGETLLELSVRQLLPHGVGDLVLVVSKGTYESIHAVVGDVFLGLPVTYVYQVTPEYRKKPLGTVHALLAAEGTLMRPFLVLNGDTLYGDAALAPVCAHLTRQSGSGGGSGAGNASSGAAAGASAEACMPGYPLKDVLPRAGRVNRAVIQVGAGGTLDAIVEQYDIGMADIEAGIYSGDELTSMNIFAFPLPVVAFARRCCNCDWRGQPGRTRPGAEDGHAQMGMGTVVVGACGKGVVRSRVRGGNVPWQGIRELVGRLGAFVFFLFSL